MNLNATLLVQIVVFAALWWFTARFVWPPITTALDERSKKIADGLAAADKAKADLQAAEARVEAELKTARESATEVRTVAEKQAASTSALSCEPDRRSRDAIAHLLSRHCSIRLRLPLPFPAS